jgi:hypothetical protein
MRKNFYAEANYFSLKRNRKSSFDLILWLLVRLVVKDLGKILFFVLVRELFLITCIIFLWVCMRVRLFACLRRIHSVDVLHYMFQLTCCYIVLSSDLTAWRKRIVGLVLFAYVFLFFKFMEFGMFWKPDVSVRIVSWWFNSFKLARLECKRMGEIVVLRYSVNDAIFVLWRE